MLWTGHKLQGGLGGLQNGRGVRWSFTPAEKVVAIVKGGGDEKF